MALQLRGARNFRSLIGTPARDGRCITGHTLLRSGHLNALDPADWDVLAALGLRAVCDLRTEEERVRYRSGNVFVHEPRFNLCCPFELCSQRLGAERSSARYSNPKF